MGKRKREVSIATLRDILVADPEAGKLFWRHRDACYFRDTMARAAQHSANNWNARYAGKEAFTVRSHGYLQGGLFGKMVRAHRVMWAMHYGEWPKGEIDHINGNPSDNRIKNLRQVTGSENMRNTRLRSNNTSGQVGVYWLAQRGKWAARLKVDGRVIHLGCFESKKDAVQARKEAEKTHGFHENHGRAT